MMNSDAVSIIDSLHAKERELNQEKVMFYSISFTLQLLSNHFPSVCAGGSSTASSRAAKPHSRSPGEPIERWRRGGRASAAASNTTRANFEV